MIAVKEKRSRPADAGGRSALSPTTTCRLAAALFFLSGFLVVVLGVLHAFPPAASRGAVLVVGTAAMASGAVIWRLPWDRWNQAASLSLIPPAMALIAFFDYFSRDPFTYAVFFMVSMAWLGLAHPQGTPLAVSPVLVVAYVVPLVVRGDPGGIGSAAAACTVPSAVILGEAVAWVSTHLRRAEARHRRGEEQFRHLFAANPQAMWVYDLQTYRFLEVNEAAVVRYGYTRDEFLEMGLLDIRPEEDTPAVLDSLSARRPGLDSTGPWRHRLKDGRIIHVEIASREIDFEGRSAVLVSVNDISERTEFERLLHHQSLHDLLTGLPNRALLVDRISHALVRRDPQRVAVLLMDLDNFTTVNESLGHASGDRVLVAVAERLISSIRPGHTAARWGGDEFAVLLDDVSGAPEAARTAERILKAFERPLTVEGKDLEIRPSIGIAAPSRTVTEAGDLLRRADMAMHAAKAAGKGRFAVFEPHMHTAAIRRLELDGELRSALDGRQFVVYYQPEVTLAERRTVGFEALVRWQHPVLGVVAPGEFIHRAEETGLIKAIGESVLLTACEQLAQWQREGRSGPFLAVNLSARQLMQQDVCRIVDSAFSRTGAEAGRLVLEVTESAFLTDTDFASRQLQRIRALGVKVALDDFGTGYSSLSHLQAFPIDQVKIDRRFVEDLDIGQEGPKGRNGRAVVAGVLAMAESLGLRTVAEGVETESQAAALLELGCRYAQGYLFARPMPIEQLGVFVEAAAELPEDPIGAASGL